MRFGGAVVVAAGIMLVLAGCGSAAPRSTYTPTVTVVPSSPVPTVTATDRITIPATPVGSPTPLASTDPNRPAGQCADASLQVSLTEPDAGAGNIDQYIVFTNTGSSSCVLRGAPGVSVVGRGNGTQLGVPASRIQSGVTDVTLAAGGGRAQALLHSVNIDQGGGPIGSSCAAERGDGLRIYPPHSTNAVFVKESIYACTKGAAWMQAGPVKAG